MPETVESTGWILLAVLRRRSMRAECAWNTGACRHEVLQRALRGERRTIAPVNRTWKGEKRQWNVLVRRTLTNPDHWKETGRSK